MQSWHRPPDRLPRPPPLSARSPSAPLASKQGFIQFKGLSGEQENLDVDTLNEQLKVQGRDRLRCVLAPAGPSPAAAHEPPPPPALLLLPGCRRRRSLSLLLLVPPQCAPRPASPPAATPLLQAQHAAGRGVWAHL